MMINKKVRAITLTLEQKDKDVLSNNKEFNFDKFESKSNKLTDKDKAYIIKKQSLIKYGRLKGLSKDDITYSINSLLNASTLRHGRNRDICSSLKSAIVAQCNKSEDSTKTLVSDHISSLYTSSSDLGEKKLLEDLYKEITTEKITDINGDPIQEKNCFQKTSLRYPMNSSIPAFTFGISLISAAVYALYNNKEVDDWVSYSGIVLGAISLISATMCSTGYWDKIDLSKCINVCLNPINALTAKFSKTQPSNPNTGVELQAFNNNTEEVVGDVIKEIIKKIENEITNDETIIDMPKVTQVEDLSEDDSDHIDSDENTRLLGAL